MTSGKSFFVTVSLMLQGLRVHYASGFEFVKQLTNASEPNFSAVSASAPRKLVKTSGEDVLIS